MPRYALVTGAAGGLGKAMAAECASRGYDLLLTDLFPERLRALAEGLARLHGVRVETFACDLAEREGREALWSWVEALGARIALLANVAGIDHEGPFAERRAAELEAIVRLNVESVVSMTRDSLEHRERGARLRIVNVASLAGFYPMPLKAVYAASKRFLLDLSRALDRELGPEGVSVTALCPAGLPTNAEVIASIESQGLLGYVTTADPGRVAGATIDRALAGRGLYIPGLLNRLLRVLGGLVPPALVAALIERRWKATRNLAAKARGIGQPA